MTRYVAIDSCDKCPFVEITRDYTEDSFETCFRWECKKKHKPARRYVDWNDKDKFIPVWCPLPTKEKLN